MKRMIAAFLAILFIAPFAAMADTPEMEAAKLKEYYRQADDNWALKAVILIALAETQHPSAVTPFLGALEEKDTRIKAYAVRALDLMEAEPLQSGMTKDLMDQLVNKEMKVKIPAYVKHVISVVEKVTGEKKAGQGKWKYWWKKNKDGWSPKPWEDTVVDTGDDEPVEAGGTEVQSIVEKMFDLQKTGLDMVICIDGTGSMQEVIDAARDGIDDLTVLIQTIVPTFRLGVVVYRDLEDMKDGAEVEQTLTPNTAAAKKALSKVNAFGGGDIPERVGNGIEKALKDPKMGWSPKSAKVIIVIGDAPCKDLDHAKKMAAEAQANPLGQKAGDVVETGRKKEEPYVVNPMITSTIGVPHDGQVASQTETEFKQVAEAGGGSYAKLEKGGDIVRQILILSFGKEFEDSSAQFVDWFNEFRANGVLR